MKLYYSPGACSLSPHIVLREAGIEPTLIPVNLGTKKAGNGKDYLTINSKVLTEGPAIIQYIADQAPEKNLAPKNGTIERSRLQEWLNFITTELHKGFGPLFNPEMPDAAKAIFTKKLGDRLAWVDKQLTGKDYLMGKNFSVADAYLFTVTGWGKYLSISIDHLPNLSAFMARMGARPAVQAALKAEKLKD